MLTFQKRKEKLKIDKLNMQLKRQDKIEAKKKGHNKPNSRNNKMKNNIF